MVNQSLFDEPGNEAIHCLLSSNGTSFLVQIQPLHCSNCPKGFTGEFVKIASKNVFWLEAKLQSLLLDVNEHEHTDLSGILLLDGWSKSLC